MISTTPFVASAIIFIVVALIASLVGYRLTCGRRPNSQPTAPPLPPINGVSLPPSPVTIAEPSRPRNAWAIYDERSARKAAKQGMGAAFFVAGATAVASFLAGSGITLFKGIGPAAWLDAAIFGVLGIGIGRMSRLASVGALALYVVERIAMGPVAGMNAVMMAAMISAFAQGIRGTFAYHRYQQQSAYPQPIPQRFA
jgi:hypothetical protein